MKRKNPIFYIISAIALVFLAIVMIKVGKDKLQDKRFNDFVKSYDVDIAFFGKVVDGQGQPVPDATVVAHVTGFSKNSEFKFGPGILQLKTDVNGNFIIDNLKGQNLAIDTIKKDSYSFNLTDNTTRSFEYSKLMGPSRIYTPDKDKPEVFVIRDVSNAVYLDEVSLRPPNESQQGYVKYDLINKRAYFSESDFGSDVKKSPLFGFYINYVYGKERSTFTIEAPAKGELLVLENMLAEMPASGYSDRYDGYVDGDIGQDFYVYLYCLDRNVSAVVRLLVNPTSFKGKNYVYCPVIADVNWFGTQYFHKVAEDNTSRAIANMKARKIEVIKSLQAQTK